MPRGNFGIVEIGKATRFGQPRGADPSALARENSPSRVRAALRRLAAAEFDITAPLTQEALVRVFSPDGKILTGAQLIAIRKLMHAMNNHHAMDKLIDMIDGRQVEPQANAAMTLEELITKSYEL